MTDISQSETLRSHIIDLLEEQKYDEALPILNDLSETHPSDREMRMYRMLVARILVLRWNLSRTGTGAAIDSCAIAKKNYQEIIFTCALREANKLIQSLNQIYQVAKAALPKRRIKRVIARDRLN
jgi:hypothetical protein